METDWNILEREKPITLQPAVEGKQSNLLKSFFTKWEKEKREVAVLH